MQLAIKHLKVVDDYIHKTTNDNIIDQFNLGAFPVIHIVLAQSPKNTSLGQVAPDH